MVEFGVLGPLEVRDGGSVVPVGPPRIRAVCAILLVRPGHLVTVEQFVDELWPGRPPAGARALVRDYVSRLRRVLRSVRSGADRLVTRRPGYLLRVEDQELDLHRFERVVAQARTATRGGEADRGARLFRQAHQLWRGEPFADVPRTEAIGAAAGWLAEQRCSTLEERFDAALAAGRETEAVRELPAFVMANPLRERPAGQLMLALYRCGRRAEALDHYQRIHRALADELGVAPGTELRTLHLRILNGDPALRTPAAPRRAATATPLTPRQLPRDITTLVGRDTELTELTDRSGPLGAGRGHPRRSPVVVVHGAPGVGKSALAVRAAHRLAAGFPDGQLYVNLNGATAGVAPLPAAEALHRMLRALGVPPVEMPPGVEEAAALFRTTVADRRLLVLLDNAATAAQVGPLLPGGSGAAVLVTSRTRLVTLDGTTHRQVGPLRPDAASAMLDALVSGGRTAADPGAARALAALCGHLPLGLRVAAARLNARPSRPVRCLLARLSDERLRLAELAVGGFGLLGSFLVSYTALSGSDDSTDRLAARALCLFGLLPVAGIDSDLAARVLGIRGSDTDRVVERLLDANLLEETAPGRFAMPDLVRLFARELGRETVAPDEQQAVLTRVLDHGSPPPQPSGREAPARTPGGNG
ncbi:BTAD domain-containing putative transcriptional regulator [Amycolatopsis sp. NPDC021455]|uniref:AfsR/SARP family transcriptional regulator n=1 Tax=Amycolatopsis sp. NPDC021455 TaxID=3154901 RepID=UPI0033C3AE5C